MTRLFKSTGFKIFIVVVAALLAGNIFSIASKVGTSPVTSFISAVFSPTSKVAGAVASSLGKLPFSFKSSTVLKTQVKELQNEVDILREQLVDYEQVVHQNSIYKEFLQLKEEHPDYTFAEAAIVGRDAADRMNSITLNKGSLADISVNDPVIYGKYLVGLVTSVSPTQCTVSTLLNPDINISAYEIRTRELGYVTTTVELAEKGQCCIPGLSTGTTVAVGGTVCTSGVGGIYPRDLIIGKIVEINDSTVDISASAIVKPGVDISQLTDVFILTDFD